MEFRVQHFQLAILLSCGIATSGCAVTSGLQTSDLRSEGIYQTEACPRLSVIRLTQDNLFALHPAQASPAHLTALFSTPHKNYRLSSGDILSIYLWAYPEITPPTNTISNEKAVESNGYQIDSQGYIQFPIIGRYKAAGKSLAQVNSELRSQLARYLTTPDVDRKSTRLNSSHVKISYAVFC